MSHNHPLTLFLLVTGAGWLGLFLALPVEDKWGQVVGNLVSEWTQSLGFVWLTKRFIERKAVEHRKALEIVGGGYVPDLRHVQ